MLSIVITKLLLAVVSFVLLFLSLFSILRVFDMLLGVDFKESFSRISQCPRSMAHYYGLRWLGTSIALGVVVCIAFIL